MTLTGFSDRRDVLEQDPFHGVGTFYGYYMLQAKRTIPALELIRKYWGAMMDFVLIHVEADKSVKVKTDVPDCFQEKSGLVLKRFFAMPDSFLPEISVQLFRKA